MITPELRARLEALAGKWIMWARENCERSSPASYEGGQVAAVTDCAVALRSALAAEDEDEDRTEFAWLIENGKQGDALRYRTFEYGLPTWTADHNKAIRYARRCDAEMAHAEDEEAWAIREHGWHTMPKTATTDAGVCVWTRRPMSKLEATSCGMLSAVPSRDGKVGDAVLTGINACHAALDFARGAIEDAIYTEDGLDGDAGQCVLQIIDEARINGTFDSGKPVPKSAEALECERARAALDMSDDDERDLADAIIAMKAKAIPAGYVVVQSETIMQAARYGWDHASWPWDNVRIGIELQAEQRQRAASTPPTDVGVCVWKPDEIGGWITGCAHTDPWRVLPENCQYCGKPVREGGE